MPISDDSIIATVHTMLVWFVQSAYDLFYQTDEYDNLWLSYSMNWLDLGY